MTGLDCVVVCNSIKYIQTQHGEEDMSMLGYADARRLVGRDAGSTEPNLSGDIPVECVGFMPVSLTAARGPGTVCTGAQPEPAQVEQLGAQPSQEGTQPHSPS